MNHITHPHVTVLHSRPVANCVQYGYGIPHAVTVSPVIVQTVQTDCGCHTHKECGCHSNHCEPRQRPQYRRVHQCHDRGCGC